MDTICLALFQSFWFIHNYFSLFPAYECFEEGSVYDYEYDPTNGNCTCKPGWFGNICQGKLKLTPLSQWSDHKKLLIPWVGSMKKMMGHNNP